MSKNLGDTQMKTFLKNVSLFIVSPFIALAYLIALPFVGLYMFVSLGVERSLKEVSETEPAKSETQSVT